MNAFWPSLLLSVLAQLIMVPSTYLMLNPLYRHEDLSPTTYRMLLACSFAMGAGCGALYALHPEIHTQLFVGTSVIAIAVLAIVLRRRIPYLLGSFFCAEFFIYSTSSIARVVDICVTGRAGATYQQTWIGVAITWLLIVIVLVLYRARFQSCLYYILDHAHNNLQERRWSMFWAVPALVYVIEVTCTPRIPDNVLSNNFGPGSICLTMVLVVLMLTAIQLVYRLMRENERTAENERENILLSFRLKQAEALESRIDAARKARHDLRHFQMAVADIASRGDTNELREYARELDERLSTGPLSWCASPIANAIIDFYAARAHELGIKPTVTATVPKQSRLSDLQMTILLGNALENAVEALERELARSEGKPPFELQFQITVREESQGFELDVVNSCSTHVEADGRGRLISSKTHKPGLGTESIRELAEKAGGFAHFSYENGLFRLLAVIPLDE